MPIVLYSHCANPGRYLQHPQQFHQHEGLAVAETQQQPIGLKVFLLPLLLSADRRCSLHQIVVVTGIRLPFSTAATLLAAHRGRRGLPAAPHPGAS